MRFIGTRDKGDVVLVGMPLDLTVSYRPGTRFAPLEVRKASDAIETYSPYLDADLEEFAIGDAGDVELPFGNLERSFSSIKAELRSLLDSGKRVLVLGGEHLLSFPVVQVYKEFYDELVFVHVDAHTDSREEYLGERLSHACVLKRVWEENVEIVQVGARSGLKSEFLFLEKKALFFSPFELSLDFLSRIGKKPVYLSLDVDVLDPAFCPGVGTPEAGGVSVRELLKFLSALRKLNIVGADIVELSPLSDVSGNSSVLGALLVREVLLLLSLGL